AGDAWTPEVVLLAGPLPPEDVERLRALLHQLHNANRTALAVVTTGDTGAAPACRWTADVDADGALTIPHLDLRITAQGIPLDQPNDLANLPAPARRSADMPTPPAEDDAAWATDVDAAGGLLPACGGQVPRAELGQEPKAASRVVELSSPARVAGE